MRSRRPTGLRAEYAVRVMEMLTGGARPMGLVLAVLLLISLDWFSTTVYQFIQLDEQLLAQACRLPYVWTSLLGLLPFLAFGIALVLLVRGTANQIDVEVRTDRHAGAAKHLVIFLSPMRDMDTIVAVSGDISDPQVRAALGHASWRMPIEAIAKHIPTLEQVIVIPSADQPIRESNTVRPGTYHDLPEFKAMVKRLTQHHAVEVSGLHDLVPHYAKGIDFENAKALVDALQAVYKTLHKRHVADNEILVDVTGGMKPATVAGATVALAKGRRFQYVSTNTYEVLTYDVTYKL